MTPSAASNGGFSELMNVTLFEKRIYAGITRGSEDGDDLGLCNLPLNLNT